MRIVSSAFGLLLASLSWVSAQVTVEVALEQEQFLRDETLPVKLRITNRSGQPLAFGKEKNWVTFNVESRDGRTVARLGDVPMTQEFKLESAMVASPRADLMPWFDFSQPGRYRVTAVVKIPQWNEEIVSPPRDFDIVRGTKIWEQEFGVPTAAGAPPEARKYILQQATSVKQLRLYARVTDLSETKVFRVTPVGPLVSFSRPEAQLDRESRLHVLFQTGARAFVYSVVRPDGELAVRQIHDYTRTRPTLRLGEDGKIEVKGGLRRTNSWDLPLAQATLTTNEVKKLHP